MVGVEQLHTEHTGQAEIMSHLSREELVHHLDVIERYGKPVSAKSPLELVPAVQ